MIQTFNTDLGSLAFQNVYDLLHIDKSLCYQCDTKLADMPTAVRSRFPHLQDNMMEMRQEINNLIIAWMLSVSERENGELHDVHYMDYLLGNILSDRGLIADLEAILEVEDVQTAIQEFKTQEGAQALMERSLEAHLLEDTAA